MYSRLTVALGLCALLGGGAARADDSDAGRFSLSGFATLGVVHSSEHLADFVGTISQPTGAGASHDWDYAPDSKLGLQLDARLTERLTAVVQVVAQHQYDNSFAPQLEWANLRLRLTPDLSVRAGRIALPIFMVSDTRLVGYANPWLRPPPEVYNTVPITNNDGIDVTWQGARAGTTTTLQLIAGRAEHDFPTGVDVMARRTVGGNITVERGATALHLHYTSATLTLTSPTIDQLFNGYTALGQSLEAIPPLAPVGAQALALVNGYRPVDKAYSALSLGFNYDPGGWFATGEWVGEHIGVTTTDGRSAYATLGVRIRSLTPYLTFATVALRARDQPALPTTALPAPLDAAMAQLNYGFEHGLNGFWGAEHSWSGGLRYELMRNADLKLQLDHITPNAGSDSFEVDRLPAFTPGKTVNVIGVGVDFVF